MLSVQYIAPKLAYRKENDTKFLFLLVRRLDVDKIKHMVMSRDQNAGRSHSLEIDNSSLKG